MPDNLNDHRVRRDIIVSTTLDISDTDTRKDIVHSLEDNFKLSIILDVLKNFVFHLIWYNELIHFWVFSIYCLVAVDYAVDGGISKLEAQSL